MIIYSNRVTPKVKIREDGTDPILICTYISNAWLPRVSGVDQFLEPVLIPEDIFIHLYRWICYNYRNMPYLVDIYELLRKHPTGMSLSPFTVQDEYGTPDTGRAMVPWQLVKQTILAGGSVLYLWLFWRWELDENQTSEALQKMKHQNAHLLWGFSLPMGQCSCWCFEGVIDGATTRLVGASSWKGPDLKSAGYIRHIISWHVLQKGMLGNAGSSKRLAMLNSNKLVGSSDILFAISSKFPIEVAEYTFSLGNQFGFLQIHRSIKQGWQSLPPSWHWSLHLCIWAQLAREKKLNE